MKKLIPLLIILFATASAFAQVGINVTGASPDGSAILDVSSTTRGLLIPRMTEAEMNAIVAPADGLMIFNTTDNCFYFRITSGWKKLISETNNHAVSDFDEDSYLTFRNSETDDDTLRIFFNGIEKYKLSARAIEPINNGGSVYIGRNSGSKDNGGDNSNTAVGFNSLINVTSGWQNTALGRTSLYELKTGNMNVALGGASMNSNRTKNRNTAVGYGAMMFADSNSVAFDAYNTAIGTHSLRGSFNPANNTGIYNTAAGGRAMNENTSGSRNSALGYHALYSNTTGNSNIALGIMALYSNTERSNLVAIGDSALYHNGTGATLSGHSSGNTAIGSKSLYANTTGSYNCAVGLKSLNSNTTGYENTASGWNSLNKNTEGKFNTAYGSRTLFNNTNGNYNVAIGTVTMYSNISGSGNSALGHSALNSNETGFNNTAIGSEALYKNTGNLNSAFGNRAGFEITSGTNNIVLGHHAGKNITTGNYNIVVGDNAEVPSATASYQMVIGDSLLLYGDISNKRIGIGTSSPKAILHIHGIGTGGGNVLFSGQRKISGAGDPPATGAGTRMMWYPDYAAFRVGQVEGNQWDKTNIGTHSLAVGLNTKASATSCIAMGYSTTASNDFATALGVFTNATGHSSTTLGANTTAPSYVETVIGQYNTLYTPVNTGGWNASDRLFVVGNGTDNGARSNALTILKNGNSGIGTEIPNEKLEVAGNIHVSGADRTIFNRSNNYLAFGTNNTERARITNVGNVGIGLTIPNEKLEVAGNIHVSGADRTIYNRSNNYLAFGTNNTERIRITNTGNVGIGTTPNTNALLHTNGTGTSAGNVLFNGQFKATSPGDPPATGAGTYMMWYPDKAAVRAGTIDGTQWNKTNIGNYSVAIGQNPTASGANSISIGQGVSAEGANSVAIGQNSSAYAANSIAIGELITANGINATGLGYDNWLDGLNATAFGASNAANGDYSTAMGNLNGASGKNSFASGLNNTAPSFVESVFGAYSTSYTPVSSIEWNSGDRLFVIGNGTSTTNRKNALTVLKNGNIGIGTDSPAELVHLRNNSGDAGIRIQSTNVSDIGFYSSSGYVAAVGINVSQGHLYLYNGGNVSVKNGRLGIGNIDPGQKLDITAGNGRVESGYSWLTNSDIRYKKNITTFENSLEKISKIRGVRYDLKEDEQIVEGRGKHIGFIAQELEKEFPEFVVTEDNGYKSVSYDKMTAVLVEAVKEQQTEIEELKKIVQQQQAQISALLELNVKKTASR